MMTFLMLQQTAVLVINKVLPNMVSLFVSITRCVFFVMIFEIGKLYIQLATHVIEESETNLTYKDQKQNHHSATLTGNVCYSTNSYACMHVCVNIIMQTSLHTIWSQKPCHKYVAVIQNFKIYHGSFHSLKGNEYLNDEVRNTDVYCTTDSCYSTCL